VSGNFIHYKHAYFYALAMLLDVEIPSLELSDRSVEAAFALASAVADGPYVEQMDREDNAEEEEMKLEWDEQLEPLP